MIRRTVLLNAAIAGALDTASFLARRPRLFRDSPGRAAGSAAFLAAWVALAALAWREKQADSTSPATKGVAGALFAGNAAMLAVHLRHHIASPRVFLGAASSAVALAAAALR